MHDVAVESIKFIDLNLANILFLFILGFIGGLSKRFYRFRRGFCAHPRHDEPGGGRHRGGGQQHVP